METGKRYFEDIKIGEKYVSPGRTITETDIVNFAGLTGDYDPIHTDAELMRKSPFGQRLAHGSMIFAIQFGLSSRAMPQPVATLAAIGLTWSYKKPVFIGDTIRVRIEVINRRETKKQDRGIVVWKRQVVNQNDDVVGEGETTSMVSRRDVGGGTEMELKVNGKVL